MSTLYLLKEAVKRSGQMTDQINFVPPPSRAHWHALEIFLIANPWAGGDTKIQRTEAQDSATDPTIRRTYPRDFPDQNVNSADTKIPRLDISREMIEHREEANEEINFRDLQIH